MKQLLSIMLLFSLSVLFTASSCKKQKNNEPQLPPETQTGAGTLGFKIDGKIYTASGGCGLFANQCVGGWGPYSGDTSIDITAVSQVQKFKFRITIKYSGTFGIHYTSGYPFDGYFTDDSNGTIQGNSNHYQTTDIYKGKVNIKFTDATISPLRGFTILAGTFEMEAVNAEGKVIKLTDGRFDIGRF